MRQSFIAVILLSQVLLSCGKDEDEFPSFVIGEEHADEYLHSIGEEYSENNKAIIRDLFLSESGLLSGVKYNCEVKVADVQKIKEVRSIIDSLIQLDRLK